MLQLFFHIEVLIAGYFFWLSLYIATRSYRLNDRPWYERLDWHASLAMLLAALFLLGISMQFVSQTPDEYIGWLRATWWALPPAVGVWFRIVFLAPHQTAQTDTPIPSWKHWGSGLVVLIGVSYGVVNRFTNLFFAFENIQPNTDGLFGSFYLARYLPVYYIHALYFLGVIYMTLFFLWRLRQDTAADSPQKGPLTYIWRGSILIAVGSTITTFNYIFFDYAIPQPLSDLVAAIGLAMVGRYLIDYNAILEERILLSDYRRAAAGAMLEVGGMLLLFHLLHWWTGATLSFISIPLIVLAGIFISTTTPLFQVWLNRVILPSWEAVLLTEMDQIQDQILTSADPQNALQTAQTQLQTATETAQTEQQQDTIREEVSRIFRHGTYHKDDEMALSDLFDFPILRGKLNRFAQQHNLSTAEVPIGEKAGLLRHHLRDQIEGMKPAKMIHNPAEMTAEFEQQFIEYTILHRGYIDKRTRREIVDEIEDTIGLRLLNNSRAYTQHLARARQRLSNQLWLAENATSEV